MPTSIYGLVDPRTEQIRYVGKTVEKLRRRLKSHIVARNLKYPVNRWVKKLFDAGLRPDIFEIETVDACWQDAEQFWISYFRCVGADLLNLAPGGDWAPRDSGANERRLITVVARGPTDAQKRSIQELRAKLRTDDLFRSEWRRRQQESIRTPEYRARMSALKTGVNNLPGGRHRPESIALMSAKAKEREARRRSERAVNGAD